MDAEFAGGGVAAVALLHLQKIFNVIFLIKYQIGNGHADKFALKLEGSINNRTLNLEACVA